MMEINILPFGIAKDIFKTDSAVINFPEELTVGKLKAFLESKYPPLKQLDSYLIAVNDGYASSDDVIQEGDEVAIIPPVSGG